MLISRRSLFAQSMYVGLDAAPGHISVGSRRNIKAVAFDAFAIFDPRSISATAEELFPGRAAELMSLWRTRQFEYTWLRNSLERYEDFWNVTRDALQFAAGALNIKITPRERARLMDAFLDLKSWPDARTALGELKAAGLRLSILSNFTERMLRAAVRNSGVDDMFEHLLSADEVRSYKPSPRSYAMGVKAMGLRRHEILFVAFAGWDAAGAASYGYPTYWANRLKAPAEELGVPAAPEGASLQDLIRWLEHSNMPGPSQHI